MKINALVGTYKNLENDDISIKDKWKKIKDNYQENLNDLKNINDVEYEFLLKKNMKTFINAIDNKNLSIENTNQLFYDEILMNNVSHVNPYDNVVVFMEDFGFERIFKMNKFVEEIIYSYEDYLIFKEKYKNNIELYQNSDDIVKEIFFDKTKNMCIYFG